MENTLIENNEINRWTLRIWRKHILRCTLDTIAGEAIDNRVGRMICRAIRKRAPKLIGDRFETLYWDTYRLAREEMIFVNRWGGFAIDEMNEFLNNKLDEIDDNELPPPPDVIYLDDDEDDDEQAERDLSLPALPYETDDLVLVDVDDDGDYGTMRYYADDCDFSEPLTCVEVDCTPRDDEEREPLYWEWDDDDIYELALRD